MIYEAAKTPLVTVLFDAIRTLGNAVLLTYLVGDRAISLPIPLVLPRFRVA